MVNLGRDGTAPTGSSTHARAGGESEKGNARSGMERRLGKEQVRNLFKRWGWGWAGEMSLRLIGNQGTLGGIEGLCFVGREMGLLIKAPAVAGKSCRLRARLCGL